MCQCQICGRTFASLAGLKVHVAKQRLNAAHRLPEPVAQPAKKVVPSLEEAEVIARGQRARRWSCIRCGSISAKPAPNSPTMCRRCASK